MEDEIRDIVSQLRLQIAQALKKVTQANSPNIYAKIQTKKGYERIEATIIEKVLHNGITPDAAVPQLESEMDGIL